MLLSLLTVGISFAILIALVGVSPIGSIGIGGEGTTGYALNATMWNTYSSLGNTLWLVLAVIILVSLCLLFYMSFKWMAVEDEKKIPSTFEQNT